VLGLGAGLGCVLASRVMHALGHAGKDYAGLDTAQSGIPISNPGWPDELRRYASIIISYIYADCRVYGPGETRMPIDPTE
jgi:hypothetical protein